MAILIAEQLEKREGYLLRAGALPFSLRLRVIRSVVDAGRIVVNAGGIVRPLGDAIPPVKKAVPDDQEYVPTLRAVVGSEGDVRITKENADGSPRVGRQPAPLPPARKSIWDRLSAR